MDLEKGVVSGKGYQVDLYKRDCFYENYKDNYPISKLVFKVLKDGKTLSKYLYYGVSSPENIERKLKIILKREYYKERRLQNKLLHQNHSSTH